MSYDPDLLIEQLEAVQGLEAMDRRIVGGILRSYGEEMVASADRLERLQRLVEEMKAR